MPAIASNNLTLTIENRSISMSAKQKRNRVKIVFGDGALTYPSGGVPLPAKESFGMVFSLDFIILTDQDDSQGILWKYDQANSKLRGYIQGVDILAAGAATLDDYPLDTTDQPFATAISIGLSNTASAGINYLGRLQELATTHAPAAQTLFCEAVGY